MEITIVFSVEMGTIWEGEKRKNLDDFFVVFEEITRAEFDAGSNLFKVIQYS